MRAGPAWGEIDLVVFDVDGTLYDQCRLRRRMLFELGRFSCRNLSLATARTLRDFRLCRELLSHDLESGEDFTRLQYEVTAKWRNITAEEVRAIAEDWLEARPLPFLRDCRFDGVAELFEACVTAGKRIGVWSDYPAAAKLDALGLSAEFVVSSGDDKVRRLKPNPAGLNRILAEADVPAARAILIGDRADHDGIAAQRAGAAVLLRCGRPHKTFPTFASYRDPLFHPLLNGGAG
jgi:HAD superfamily hydrolase (TIGR01549 family)